MAGFGVAPCLDDSSRQCGEAQVTDTCRVWKNQVVPTGNSGAGATGAWNWVLWRRLWRLGLVTGLE